MTTDITFVIGDQIGGIAYMNHQIIEYAALADHFRVHILLIKSTEDNSPKFKEKFKAHTVEYFNYSELDNYYTVLKLLNGILNKYPGIMVTNSGFEMQSIKLFGTRSLVYSIVHDFHNLKLAFEFYKLTNVFICHTETYARTLKSASAVHPRIDYLPHGVKVDRTITPSANRNGVLKIAFVGRLVEAKGARLLHAIACGLRDKGINTEWKIIGQGELKKELEKQWEHFENVSFFSPLHNEELTAIIKDCDLFVSPSVFEGYGIALLECMACGLVPVVYDIPVGVAATLANDIAFRIVERGATGFIEKIELLHNDRDLLFQMKNNAQRVVLNQYDIKDTSEKYLNSFLNTNNLHCIPRKKNIQLLGVFDKSYFPNGMVRMFKKWLYSAKKAG